MTKLFSVQVTCSTRVVKVMAAGSLVMIQVGDEVVCFELEGAMALVGDFGVLGEASIEVTNGRSDKLATVLLSQNLVEWDEAWVTASGPGLGAVASVPAAELMQALRAAGAHVEATVGTSETARAVERACDGLGSVALAVSDAVSECKARSAASESDGRAVATAVGAYILGEVEATLWTVGRLLVRLEAAAGSTWSADRRWGAFRARVNMSEAWQSVRAVRAVLGVSDELADENITRLGRKVGRRLRGGGVVRRVAEQTLVVSTVVSEANVRRLFTAAASCVARLEQIIEGARELVGDEAARVGAWSLFVAEAQLIEAELDLKAAAVPEVADQRFTLCGAAVAIGELAALSGDEDLVVPAGSEAVAITAAAEALWALEGVLLAREIDPAARATERAVAARIKVAEAAAAVSVTHVDEAARAAEPGDVGAAVRAMQGVVRAGETGSAVRYGVVLRDVAEDGLADQLAVLGRAVRAVATVVDGIARELAGRWQLPVSEPPTDEWLGAAAASAWSAGDLLQAGCVATTSAEEAW